jgi:hypothetical protein
MKVKIGVILSFTGGVFDMKIEKDLIPPAALQ